jgi:2,4-dienoyl-CoA reductase-like NADH-dependent reductase (Old Yellow Enzyme family)/thioredoxin reductase
MNKCSLYLRFQTNIKLKIMLNLKNRFIMAPVKTGYSDGTGIITARHLEFYKQRAPYLGAVIPEPLYIDKGLRELPTQIGIDGEDKIQGLKELTGLFHSYDTKAIAHLNHPGRMANPMIPGNYFVSSTDRACEAGGAAPQRMTRQDMDKVVSLFVNAAGIAEKAGFDILELQFGHGYLMAQFISPFVNDRNDEYGGSFENRVRFPLEVLDAVMQATSLPVIVRISGDEMIPQGIHLDEMIRFVKILKDRGVAAVHVSAGTVCNTPPWYFQHMFVPKGKTWEFASKIKKETGVEVIYIGQINTVDDIENLKKNFGEGYYAVGRALVADPDFVGKYLGEKQDLIRPCLACSDGCLGGVKSGKGLGCLVNPEVNYKGEIKSAANGTKSFAVVGGGLAGCEAAYRLHRKGHKVTVFESGKIGGQFDLAYLPPKKQSLKKIVDYYEEYLRENGIEIVNKNAEPADIAGFDEAVIATGSVPSVPPVEGLKDYFWAEILEDDKTPSGKNIAVIGGGLIGTEVAHKLLKKGNKVYIVEMLDEIARGMEMIEKKMTLMSFKSEPVEIYTGTTVKKVSGTTLHLQKGDESFMLENIDHIVLATGMKPYHPFEQEDVDVPLHFIGDAHHVGKAQDAISEAFDLVNRIG